MSDYNGYDLFEEITDPSLQARNRAVCLSNIFDANSDGVRATPKGVSAMLGYMNAIPLLERPPVMERLTLLMGAGGNA